ncbi:MAG: ABC transporter substrate-binding protein [Candidatus Poribacteria bacterium]|nr:ABC transporter substrate-binding protein [Candidatus Poribacteria bacterium]
MKFKTFTFIFFFAIAGLVAGMIGCERVAQVFEPATQPEGFSGEIPIGVVLPQTGDLGPGEFGPGALVMENSFNMALEEINTSQLLGDVSLKFITEDDMSTVEGAIEAFNKLIHQDKVSVILGVWTSQVAKSVFPIAQENGVVAFSPVVVAAGLAEIGEFIFRASHSTDVLIPSGVKVTQEKLGYQRVATIADTVDFASRVSDEGYRKALADSGVEVVTTETFETGDTDFSDQLTRINALNPDAIFVSAQQIEVIKILTQGRELGISADVPFISIVLSVDEIRSAGAAAEGAITFTDWVSTADTPGNQAFVQNYTARYGMEPSVWAAQPYAAVYILAEAITNAQSTDSKAIAAALADIKDFDTILGKFSFDANGDAIYDPVVLIVKNGKLEVFE